MDLGYWILNDVVWVKHNPHAADEGARFCNAHETLLWAKKSADQPKYTFHYRALKAGNDDKQMRSDWHLPICSGGERETVNGKKAHTTQKPESLLHRVIAATSNPGDLILDPFCGTGTTAAVAKKLGRNYITIDGSRCMSRSPVGVWRRSARPAGRRGRVRGRAQAAGAVRLAGRDGGAAGRHALRLKGAQTTAVVHADGTITADGHRGSIHKVGAACLGLPNCNGWTAWLFPDPKTGEEAPAG